MLAVFWTWGGWNALVAIGTLALAGVTVGLAAFTLKAVRESREAIKLQAREVKAVEAQTTAIKRQATLTAAAMEAGSRPVLVSAIPKALVRKARERLDPEQEILRYVDGEMGNVRRDEVHFRTTPEMIYCSVPLRNVGAGVAFIQRIELVTTRTESFPLTGKVSHPVVPPDATTRTFFIAVRRQDNRASDWEEIVNAVGPNLARFTIRVVYTGASRELLTLTEIETTQVPPDDFICTSQKVWTSSDGGGDEDLLVSTENIMA